MGRHSVPDAQTETASSPGTHGTRGDLQLLRQDPAVRARCLIAAVLPFAVYTVALIVAKVTYAFLLWVWIPIVVAGILVGAVLDLGFRAQRQRARRHSHVR